jgi:transposase
MTVMIGIDPHKASHTAVVIANTECVLDELRVRACSKQTDQLRSWAAPFPDRVWAIESARGLGYLLAQQLVAAGEIVVDVPPVLWQEQQRSDPRAQAPTLQRHLPVAGR